MAKTSRFRYSIGIDLGTSNSALCYVDLREPGLPRVLEIDQWESTDRSRSFDLLPSFAWFADLAGESVARSEWRAHPVVGVIARDTAPSRPGEVIASAKSWLAHSGVDRSAPILPWGSHDVPHARKLSPVDASALYLNYLRESWNRKFASEDDKNRLERQHVVIAVPASFDQAAQKLTLEAARRAGLPAHVKLLEEPQAAFHAWLESHPEPGALARELNAGPGDVRHVLVVDVGGGTTDLSRFSIGFSARGAAQVRRVAVSDHILLGGDNMDLALAYRLERGLHDERNPSELHAQSWQSLVAEARSLKERVLELWSSGKLDEKATYHIGVQGVGGGLFAGSRSVSIGAGEILQLITEGFFPLCDGQDSPRGVEAGFREMGLPYARDTAITRHLAAFLRQSREAGETGRETVDAILFNGGAMTPPQLQQRLQDRVAEWQEGHRPGILGNEKLDLAVAMGAAAQGAYAAAGRPSPISGGAGHGYYLEAAARGKKDARYLVCLLPRGTALEAVQKVQGLDLGLQVNRPVQFRLYDSARRGGDHAGQLLKWQPEDFRRLPSLQTVARLHPDRAAAFGREAVPVNLEAGLNSLGLLQVYVVSDSRKLKPPAKWELEFDMRALPQEDVDAPTGTQSEAAKGGSPAEAPDETLPDGMETAVEALLSEPLVLGLPTRMEKALGRKRHRWPRSWLRHFWEMLHARVDLRASGPEREAAWLNLAGFFLRPGFGVALDDYRMEQLWQLQVEGLCHTRHKEVRSQYHLMWRRTAGGLDAARQMTLYDEALPLLESHARHASEGFGMAASFERLPREQKEHLLGLLLDATGKNRGKAPQLYLWALGRLLGRVPLYAGEESVLPPSDVEKAFAFFRLWDFAGEGNGYLPILFSQAGRLTGNRHNDLPQALRSEILEKMAPAGAPERLRRPLREVIPLERQDIDQLLGDSLPMGLAIGSFS